MSTFWMRKNWPPMPAPPRPSSRLIRRGILARGGAYEQLEGPDHTRNVVAQFPSLQAAHDCYHSEGYQAAIKLGEGGFQRSLMIVETID